MIKNNLKMRQGRGYSGLARVLTLVAMMLLFVVTGGRADNVTFKVSDLYESLPEGEKLIDLPYEWKNPSGEVTVTIAYSDDSSSRRMIVYSGALQLNGNYKITVSAASGGTLDGILFTTLRPNMRANATASNGTYNNGTWTPDDDTNSVTFTFTGDFYISEIYVGDLNSMNVSLKEGTEDAESWMAKAGESGSFGPLPLTDVAAGTTVTLQYWGTKEVKSVNLPSTIAVQEVTEDISDGWNGNEDPLTAANLPGFKEMTMEDTQNWKGVPNGPLVLIYGFSDDGKLKLVMYQNGNLSESGEMELSLGEAYYYIYYGYNFYYTTGVFAGAPVPPTANDNEWQFTMPDDEVELTIHYYSLAGVTLDVSGSGGTAKLLDREFKPLGETAVKEDDRFVLMVDRNEAYDFKTTFSTGDDSKDFMTEFSAEEYVEYFEYVKSNNIGLSLNTVLLWVTMPHVETSNLNLEVDFKKQETYTIIYQPASGTNSEMVFCKMAMTVNGAEEVSYAALQRGSTMGDGAAVWNMKIAAAFAPTKIAFVTAAIPATDEEKNNLTSSLENVDLTDAVVSQSTDSWIELSGAKYLIIGGNARVVTAAFIADANSMTVYRDYAFDAATTTGGVTYQLAVCATDEQGRVTTPGTVKAPAVPATTPAGKEFAGWRGYQYDSNGRASEKIYAANEGNISVRENATFTAVWTPIQVTAVFAMNGGTGVTNPVTRDYGQTLGNIGEPTRPSCVLDYWAVIKAVNESGVLFGMGSKFNTNTPLTADIGLYARWKHVHNYVSYAIEKIPKMEKYMKYNKTLHITACDCEDMYTAEHEFNPAGRCVCGYEKPGAEQVQVDIVYGKLEGNSFTTLSQGLPEFPKRGEEVKVHAFPNWGDLEFQKWQYSADGGETWKDLAAFEIVGFLVPCNMTVRALYVNPVTTPTIELTTRQYDDKAEYEGQTYTMDNILYQMNYKLPDGYKLLDAGVRMGDNNGISYYFIQQVIYTASNKAKGIMAGVTAGVIGLGVVSAYFLGAGGDVLGLAVEAAKAMTGEGHDVNYLETEENVLEKKLNAATLAKYMYEGTPVNVPKYAPVYWEANAPTKGQSGTVSALPPLRFAQRNNQDHYIYGIGYMRYRTPNGEENTLYTDAIAATVNDPNHSTVKTEQAAGARMAKDFDPNTAAARRAPKREPESQQTSEQLDMSTILAPQTQLVVYADGTFNAQLSDSYGYGETATVTAPAVSGKTFSYWTTGDGAVISTSETLTLTMNVNTTLQAVYGGESKSAKPAITSATRTNDGQKIAIHAIANGTADGAGFVYSTTATEPVIGADGVTQVAAVKYSSLSNELPASVLDRNNCWSGQIAPDDADAVYHVRAYATIGGTTTYGDVKDVRLADLESGVMMIANLSGFEQDLDEVLTDVKNSILTLDETTDNSDVLAEWNGKEAVVTVKRTLQTGNWNTFCAPFAIDNPASMGFSAVKELQSATLEGYTLMLNFGDATSIEAGKPYLVQVENTVENPQFFGVTVSQEAVPFTSDYVDFIPTLGKTLVTGPEGDKDNAKAVLFLAAENRLVSPSVVNDPEQQSSYMKGFRAYFQLKNASAARAFSLNFGNGETTGIQLAATASQPTGQKAQTYDLQGRKLQGQPTTKGVYIQNGKKTVVK